MTKEHWTLSGMLYPMCSRAVLVHGWGCAYIDPVGTGYDGVAKMFRYITLVTYSTYNTRVTETYALYHYSCYRILVTTSTSNTRVNRNLGHYEANGLLGAIRYLGSQVPEIDRTR